MGLIKNPSSIQTILSASGFHRVMRLSKRSRALPPIGNSLHYVLTVSPCPEGHYLVVGKDYNERAEECQFKNQAALIKTLRTLLAQFNYAALTMQSTGQTETHCGESK